MQKAKKNACNKTIMKEAKDRKCLLTTIDIFITFADVKPKKNIQQIKNTTVDIDS